MTEENRKQKFEEIIGIVFIICFGLGGGYYFSQQIDENTDFRIDFEKRDYIPYSFNNDLLLINKKNGKTYKLNEYKTEETTIYKYDYIARPKAKKVKVFKNVGKYKVKHSDKDPLGILNTKRDDKGWAF